ncbi:MAG: glycosyltransferase family 2 protein [Spirochaetes bacterium]|nr:glycosyltransferase family 2 protein [Spirochaetota bacterium]
MKKKISIVTACFNEEENVEDFYGAVKKVFDGLKNYRYEHIFIDNSSTDNTVAILKKVAKKDRNLKIIVNSRNFGHIRSPFYGLLQMSGDAVILTAADFQDPPELIRDFLKKWEEGYKIVIGKKTKSEESRIFFIIRKLYYFIVNSLSEIELIKNFTGFGLYDKTIIDILKRIDDPYPYFRGLICDIGFEKATVEFIQPSRKRGFTKNNIYTLYDMAMLGITNHSKIPLRMMTIFGIITSIITFLIALVFLIRKLVLWDALTVGMAPVLIGILFLASIQLVSIGLIAEYIGSIYTQVLKRPLVIEKERVNFEKKYN